MSEGCVYCELKDLEIQRLKDELCAFNQMTFEQLVERCVKMFNDMPESDRKALIEGWVKNLGPVFTPEFLRLLIAQGDE